MPDGDAAHTDFIVVSCNQDASLTGFVPGLVATEAMYKDRSALLKSPLARPYHDCCFTAYSRSVCDATCVSASLSVF